MSARHGPSHPTPLPGAQPPLHIAVVGGGINGVSAAEALAADGHRVELFERGVLMGETSSRSSKLLHGGLRYLETGEWRLVREALAERSRWIADCPQHAQPLRLALPVYSGVSRPPLLLGAGIALYALLAGRRGLGPSRWLGAREFARQNPALKAEGLRGGFYFFDGRMDDRALGSWLAGVARTRGVTIHEHTPVQGLDAGGSVRLAGGERRFDLVVNAAGPWAEALLRDSGLAPAYGIDWVRGSHIVFDEPLAQACLLQVPGEKRIFFVLPWQGRTLVGTTEVAQSRSEPIAASAAEIDYLLAARNHYFREAKTRVDVSGVFSGVRPLLHFEGDPGRASREYALAREGRVLSIYGGKWTTARALGRHVARMVRESLPPRR